MAYLEKYSFIKMGYAKRLQKPRFDTTGDEKKSSKIAGIHDGREGSCGRDGRKGKDKEMPQGGDRARRKGAEQPRRRNSGVRTRKS